MNHAIADGMPPGAQLFTTSADRVVTYLAARTPLQDWSVSRVTGREQVHLHVADPDDPLISVGQRVPWEDTFCHRMYAGAARVVPDSTLDSDYCDLPDVPAIRAYAGVPISDEEGELFGILCGVSTEPLAEAGLVDAELVRLLGDLLSAQLVASREQDRMHTTAQLAAAQAQTDSLTGLLNRRGWDAVAADALHRCQAYGDQAVLAVVDLDGLKAANDTQGHAAGDALLRRAAAALTSGLRAVDVVARYGGDEFVVLGQGVTRDQEVAWADRLAGGLAEAGVAASIGSAHLRAEDADPGAAFGRADAAMYTVKTERRARRLNVAGSAQTLESR